MRLTDAVEIDDLIIEVIQDLDFRRFFFEQNLGSSSERLDIRRVFRKYFYDLLGETIFSSYIT